MNQDFLPQGYEPPKSQLGNYMKLQQGDNRFRVLSKPIIGWLDWDNNKPLRFRSNEKPSAPINPAKPIKHFWAFVVWNYETKSLQILEITQSGIQQQITGIARDPDWGSPFDYDLSINKTGQEKETKYVVNPKPHKAIADEIQSALISAKINLEALFSGGDPFEGGAQ